MGVEKDLTTAIYWLRQAAITGDSGAQYALAYHLAEGSGIDRDYKEAARYYRMAADQNNVAAQNNLGGMFLRGEGVTTNYFEAMKLFWSSAHGGGDANAQSSRGLCMSMGMQRNKTLQKL